MSGRPGKPVSIRAAVKRYADVIALKGVSLDVAAGEFCTLLGASGSGKTTLLKVIAGFEPLDEGQIEVAGRNLSGIRVAARNIGMVFQNYALFPHLSVRGNVAFGLEMRGLAQNEIRRKTDAAIARVNLEGLADRMPAELSGGQQQRVALARALVIEPDILLMDEPLGALDKNLRQSIQLELKQLHAELGATTVYVTHDQEEALHLSDRIVILDDGCIVQSGTPRELYRQPVNRFVAGFLGECNFIRLADGSEVGLRPESLGLLQSGDSRSGQVTMTLQTAVFMGPDLKLVGAGANGRVIALLRNRAMQRVPQPGERIDLAFDDKDIIRFDEQVSGASERR